MLHQTLRANNAMALIRDHPHRNLGTTEETLLKELYHIL